MGYAIGVDEDLMIDELNKSGKYCLKFAICLIFSVM